MFRVIASTFYTNKLMQVKRTVQIWKKKTFVVHMSSGICAVCSLPDITFSLKNMEILINNNIWTQFSATMKMNGTGGSMKNYFSNIG